MRTLKAILFDFGGTLDSDAITWLERFHAIYKEEGLELPRETFAPAFYRSDDNLPARFDLSGRDLEATVRFQVDCVMETLAPGNDDLAARVTRRFTAESRQALRRNRPVLERLARSYRLGIVSNFYGNMESVLAGEGLLELFGAIADSEQVGALKPDKEIFLHATRGLGVEPSEACMVGDNVKRDMAGAEALGMPHIWVAGERQASERCCTAAPILRRLVDLEGVLARPASAP